ncbi:MAG: YheU family protein [Pseudomonadota bacterium]
MAQLVVVPQDRLQSATLLALLEEFASRDGTDYGSRERSLEEKTDDLRQQLEQGVLTLVFDLDSEQYDLCDRERLQALELA